MNNVDFHWINVLFWNLGYNLMIIVIDLTINQSIKHEKIVKMSSRSCLQMNCVVQPKTPNPKSLYNDINFRKSANGTFWWSINCKKMLLNFLYINYYLTNCFSCICNVVLFYKLSSLSSFLNTQCMDTCWILTGLN